MNKSLTNANDDVGLSFIGGVWDDELLFNYTTERRDQQCGRILPLISVDPPWAREPKQDTMDVVFLCQESMLF